MRGLWPAPEKLCSYTPVPARWFSADRGSANHRPRQRRHPSGHSFSPSAKMSALRLASATITSGYLDASASTSSEMRCSTNSHFCHNRGRVRGLHGERLAWRPALVGSGVGRLPGHRRRRGARRCRRKRIATRSARRKRHSPLCSAEGSPVSDMSRVMRRPRSDD